MDRLRFEAESLILSGYSIETNDSIAQFASNGSTIKLDGQIGTASKEVTASEAGTYDIEVAYFDGNDGKSTARILLNGVEIEGSSWVFDANTDDAYASVNSRFVFKLEGITLTEGDVLTIEGAQNGGEYARLDYVDLVPSQRTTATSEALTSSSSTNSTNAAPDAIADSYTITASDTLTISTDNGVIANDLDADGDVLDVSLNQGVSNGALTLNSNGSFTYIPDAGFSGIDTFSYTVSDGMGGTDTATVTITVTGEDEPILNISPVATADNQSISENQPVSINLIANDSDADGDPLDVTGLDVTDTLGSVVLAADGETVSYDPGTAFDYLAAGETATDTFSYTVSDGKGGTDTATVTITVTGEDEPVTTTPTVIRKEAEDFDTFNRYKIRDSDSASNGQLIERWGSGSATWTFDGPAGTYDVVLGYFDESDGQSTVSVFFDDNLAASWVFDRDQNRLEEYTIVQSFYIAPGTKIRIDGQGNGGEPARIDYMEFRQAGGDPDPEPENRAPVATADSQSISENQPVSINLIANDSDADGDPLDVTGLDVTDTLGSVVLAADGETVSYDPGTAFDYLAAGETATDTFSYTVSDGKGNTDTATVTITVTGEDEPPVATGTADYSSANQGVTLNLATEVALLPAFGALNKPRLMPIGDSITAGEHSDDSYPGGYRVQFWQRAIADGLDIDFVGRQSNGSSDLGDKNHESYPGRNIKRLNELVVGEGALSTNPADAVLIMAGTNDANQGQGGSGMIGRMRNMINAVLEADPDVYIYVSTIPPLDEPKGVDSENANAQLFNSLLPDLIQEFQLSHPSQVFLVNAGGSLTEGDMNGINSDDPTVAGVDGLHPTNGGYTKMGNAWYEGVFNPESLAGKTNLIGSSFNDILIGNTNSNILEGGAGDDQLTGGGGADFFRYSNRFHGVDAIADFSSDDAFLLSASGFGGGLVAGMSLNSNTFIVDGNPVSGSGTFLFSTSSRTLSFDQDGTGDGSALAIATFTNSFTALQANQIQIIA